MFRVPVDDQNSPRWFYDQLIVSAPQFQVLRDGEPSVGFLLRTEPKERGGRTILGTVYMPSVSGDLSKLFDWMLEQLLGLSPTYLFVLDAGFWDASDKRLREILMFHEMCHCDQARDAFGTPRFNRLTGEPIWRLIGHDIEEFNAVVARYGAYSPEVLKFVEAVHAGEAQQ